VGKVLWHSLTEDGKVEVVDIQFGDKKYENVSVKHLNPTDESSHSHKRTGKELDNNKKKKKNENMKESHHDRKEGKMAKYDAKEIAEDSIAVFKMIDKDMDLPEWLEAKITKSADYMNSVKDYLTHHMKEDVQEGYSMRDLGLSPFFKKLNSDQRQAVSIALIMGGNMTGAIKAIEKIKKGLSKDKKVKNALKMANEGTCGYGVDGKLGEEPAGPHLMKKKKRKLLRSKTEQVIEAIKGNLCIECGNPVNEDLKKWFKDKWVNIGKKNKDGSHPPCGTSGKKRGYAKCVPKSKASRMTKKQKASATRRKRSAQNKAGRGGTSSIRGGGKKPINVSTKPKK
tara:strand:+ start:795 stop:1814 length:1020 start_codon:yes stop_codon:yes gene_type:complete